MNAKISQHMTLLGICALAFYGAMFASGKLSLEMMPQFVISAAIFLTSGRVMRRAARLMAKESDERTEKKKEDKAQQPETDWSFLTQLLNWTAALLVVGVMAIFLMKPIGLGWTEAFSTPVEQDHYFAEHVP